MNRAIKGDGILSLFSSFFLLIGRNSKNGCFTSTTKDLTFECNHEKFLFFWILIAVLHFFQIKYPSETPYHTIRIFVFQFVLFVQIFFFS